jgi:hypothetical protein
MVMGYVAKAFEDLPELAFNLMRENLTKNATTCLLLASLVFQIFIEGFVYFILTSNLGPVETGELRSSLNLNSFAFHLFLKEMNVRERSVERKEQKRWMQLSLMK